MDQFECKKFERIDICENKWSEYLIDDNIFDDLFVTKVDPDQDNSGLLWKIMRKKAKQVQFVVYAVQVMYHYLNNHLQKTNEYEIVFVVQKDRDECDAYIMMV